MLNALIESITHFITSFIGQTGYLGIFLLMTAESALIPIPSEVTMTFSGFLASTGQFSLFWVILIGAVANLVGSLLAYWLGYWAEEHVIRGWIRKYGKYLLITEEEYDRSERWFRKYGENVVFLARILPVVRTFISLPAGLAEMNIWKFSLFTFIGSLIWSAALAYLGFYLGSNWQSLENYYRKFEYAIVAGIVILAFIYINKKVKELRKKH